MSDYTELCARLRRMSDMTTTNNDIRDVLRAADAIESQALEIAELRTWRDEAVRLCAKRNCAGRDRRIRDLEEDNDALRARAEAAEKDAERYWRLLEQPDGFEITIREPSEDPDFEEGEWVSGHTPAEIDTAIRAAMAGETA